MKELPAINCHWVKAYYSVSTCMWAVLVIIWLHIFLEFTTMLLLFFRLHVYRHFFLLNFPCWSSQHPCIAAMLYPIQSLSCWCFPSTPNFERQLIISLFYKLYSIVFCNHFAHLNYIFLLIFILENIYTALNIEMNLATCFETILNTQILGKKMINLSYSS